MRTVRRRNADDEAEFGDVGDKHESGDDADVGRGVPGKCRDGATSTVAGLACR